jgi:hypothetical protein
VEVGVEVWVWVSGVPNHIDRIWMCSDQPGFQLHVEVRGGEWASGRTGEWANGRVGERASRTVG